MANDPILPLSSSHLTESLGARGFPLEAGILLAGKYRLVRPAGFGGMGVVWVARNEATNAEVAIKVLVLSREGVDEETIARFRREAHAAAQLSHRGIVRVFDLIELHEPDGASASEGRAARSNEPTALVMVMELLRGDTLAARIEAKKRFTLDETLEIVLPVLSALGYAHGQGIVHRDLKPDNVFLVIEPDGHVLPKILDFGISKLIQPAAPRITTDGAMLGTPSYMSPEQARGRADVDARADVFAAGIVLYEMLAGESPFASQSYHSVVAAILERDPAPIPGLPPDVWRVMKRALEKPAELRYGDASELAAALRKAAQVAGATAPEASGPFPASSVDHARQGLGVPSRVSIGDRSVPPAPFREPQATVPSMYASAKKRARIVGVSVALVALGAAIGIAGLVTHAARAHDDPTPASAPIAAPVVAPVEAPSAAAPVTPPPTIVTMTPDPAATTASQASHARATHAPGAPTHATKPAPPPAASSKSTVVRDPGF